jgi:succinyl-CoA synthetase alpha subunit
MRLRYYTTARGDRPVAAYIEGRSRADQAVIAVALTEIAAYRKQTQKAPVRHVKVAQRRMQEVLRCREDTRQ